ncbi:MAG: hypothetical protein QW806_07710 [Nitrososphaerota archaeon]
MVEMTLSFYETEISRKIKDIEMEYLNSFIKIVLIRNIPYLEINNEVYNDLKQGTVLNVRRWIGEKLIEAKVAKYEEDKIDINYLRQLEWKERNIINEVQEVPKYFYLMIREKMKYCNEEEKKEFYNIIQDIISLRLAKLIRIAIMPTSIRDIDKKISIEEEILFEALKSIIENWKKVILRE